MMAKIIVILLRRVSFARRRRRRRRGGRRQHQSEEAATSGCRTCHYYPRMSFFREICLRLRLAQAFGFCYVRRRCKRRAELTKRTTPSHQPSVTIQTASLSILSSRQCRMRTPINPIKPKLFFEERQLRVPGIKCECVLRVPLTTLKLRKSLSISILLYYTVSGSCYAC
jgi:hypothetical protein